MKLGAMNSNGKIIAMFLDTDFPPDSRVENEALSLVEAGHEVHLFALSYQKHEHPEEKYRSFTVHRYFAPDIIYRLSALVFRLPFYNRFVGSKVRKFIEKVKPDVLHIHDMVIASCVFEVNRKYSIPTVLDLHENRPEIMQFYPHLKSRINQMLMPKSQWMRKQGELIKQSDATILVTKEAVEWARNHYQLEKHFFVDVPNSIKKNVFLKYPVKSEITGRFEGKINIVYVGDTGLRRGTLDAIVALNHLKDSYPNIHLILVGKSSEDLILQAKIEELGLSGFVSMEGWQDVSLFPSYISVAKVAICPLHRNLHHDTTYANKIFQYMAMNVPQVVSDCDAQANVIKQYGCGLVHKASDPKDLAEKINVLLNDPALASNLGNNGYNALMTKLSWDHVSNNLCKIYNSRF